MMNQIRELEHALGDEKAEINHLEDKIAKASSIIEALERENNNLKEELRQVESKGGETTRDNNRLRSRISEL